MKRLFTLCVMCSIIWNISYAQNTLVAQSSQLASENIAGYTRDQLEDFISNNYSYSSILSDLNVTNQYVINKQLTFFVSNHIHAFYNEIYNGVAQHQLNSSNDVVSMYTNFIDSTKTIMSSIDFSGKPKGNDAPPVKQLNGPCVNMDFEDGDLTGWDLFDGQVDGLNSYSFINSVTVGANVSHQIESGGVDPIVGIPMVNPDGGSYSCRLGDGAVSGFGAARMSQTFMVTSNNAIFSYSYAVVFQDPGHIPTQQPYFSVRVYDQFGNDIQCGTYNVISGPGAVGFSSGPGSVLYKDWTTVFSQLNGYIGQNVTIEFTSGDCGLGGHYGYAYVDANCQTFGITTSTGDTVLCVGDTMTLFAPEGGDSYLWNTGETTSSINISNAGHYTVDIIPVQGNACEITLAIDIAPLAVPVAIFTSPSQVCFNDNIVTFSDSSTITNPATIATWQWDFGDGISTPFSSGNVTGVSQTSGTYTHPIHTFSSTGMYNVILTVTATGGHCSNSISHPVNVVALPTVNINASDNEVCDGTSVTLTGSGANSYTWDNGVTNGVAFVPSVGTIVYTVTGTDINGCTDTSQATIKVDALPIVTIVASDNEVCDGTTVTLSGSGANTYSWDNGVTNGIAFVPNLGSTTYTVIGTDINGCKDTTQTTLVVDTLPTINVVSSGNEVCQGTSVTLNGSGGVTYTWGNGISNGIAFVPAVGTTIYTVTGTDVNGCINNNQDTVLVHPTPNINALGTTVCFGDSVLLKGEGGVSYTWDNGVIDSVAFLPNVGSTIYTVTGTDINGCTDTSQVTVNTNALPSVMAIASDNEVCDGASVTLSGSGASTYTWDNGVTNGIAFVPNLGSTTYTVIGTDVNGCTDTTQTTIVVDTLPTINVVSSGNEVCQGTSVTLNGAGGTTYIWDNGISNGIAFVPAVGTTIYAVTGTDVNGCINNNQDTVIVHPTPNITAVGDTVCLGDSVLLKGFGGATYSWNNGVIDSVAFLPNSGITSYTVTGTSVFGCQNIYSVDVLANTLPNVSAGNDFSICNGTSALLTGSGASIYNWNNGVTNGVAFFPTDTATYTVIGTDVNGCIGTDSAIIYVIPIPIVNFTADKTAGCAPLEAVFTNQSTGNLVDCQWSFSNGINLVGCGAVSNTFDNEGCYDVTLTVSTPEGCVNSMTLTNYVCVLANPVADFYANPDQLSTINWTAQMVNQSTGATNYLWNFGDGSSSQTDFEPTHDYPHDDERAFNIKLIVTSADGCIDSTSRTISMTNELIYYVPNAFTPNGDGDNEVFKPVFGAGYDPYDYTFYVFNRWGELLFESHNTDVGWDGSYYGGVAQDGVYIWKVIVGLQDSAKKETKTGHFSLLK